ncbi:uncharacterized protein VP01_4091g3 [Puccinia sorghi]|uniref:Retrotransposon gag domain-containing protein n=1 Tax=Puccinia sorghi TaxID=27349 RepID=A0A0L6URD0_9BASI|nr:uncharacterized protein VP01_4091g3 [Puccinia sorghi]
MEALNARLDELMRMMGEERAQRLAMEETLRQTQARLNATAGQQNPTSAPASSPNPLMGPVVLLPRALLARLASMLSPIPSDFPPTPAKWPVPGQIFNGEPVLFNDFVNYFRCFFDHNHWHHAKVTLRNLRQTGTMLAYTQDFNQHACTVGWADAPLMLYQHSLKENIQLAVVMSNIEFDSLQSMQAMALCKNHTPVTL